MKLQILNAVMRLHESNIRNLHWNTAGEEFDDAHKVITEEYYDLFATNIDKISEIMGMLDIPVPNYVQVIDVIKSSNRHFIVVKSDKLYNRGEIITLLDTIFGDITGLILEVLDEDIIQDTINTGIRAELENILYTFDFQKRYINKRRKM